MPKLKSLVVSSKIEVASRKTCCKHNKQHVISKGEFRLSVKNPTQGESYYCIPCAKDMVEQSKAKLEDLEQQLSAFD